MRTVYCSVLVAITAGLTGLAGCESAPRVEQPMYFVPSAVLRNSDVPAEHMLPTNSFAEAAIARGVREAYGPAVGEASEYAVYTYDHEPISTPWGYGYRTRYVLRTGVTLP